MLVNIVFFNLPHLSYSRGGEKWIKEVASYLSSSHKITVITTDYRKLYDLKDLKFNYVTIKFKKRTFLLNDIRQIKEYLKDTDLIYSFYHWAGTQREILKHSNRVVFGHHGMIKSFLQRIYYRILESDKKIKNVYHHFLTQYRADLYKRRGFNKIFVIPNFIDLKKYRPKTEITDKFRILSPGVVTKEKGVDILFKVANVLKSYKDIEFYVAGHKYHQLNFPDNVKYLGLLKEDDYIKVISNGNLLFLPTKIEAFSFSILENLAVGNPAVVSNLPDIKSAFGETEVTYYAELNNVKDYLKGILKYYKIWKNSPKKYEEICKEARMIAMNFDSEIILPKIEEMFKIVYDSN
jgi:1,2-diacylglycerol-3-alpha-glucose alpha-1,2-glucosyltransferase